MKKKEFLIIALLTAGFTGAYAQKNDDKLVKFGIRAGVNFQKFYGSNHYENDKYYGNTKGTDFQPGFHAGITADMLVTPVFYLQPGLLYAVKGAKSKSGNQEIIQKTAYIELPVNLLFKPELRNGRLLLGAGPYIAYGINGQNKRKEGSTVTELDARFKNTITALEYINDNFYYIRPWDFGANALIGYELNNGLSFQLNGQLGLNKVNSGIDGATTEISKTNLKNLGAGISLAYKF
ncbi:MAG: porin family protein [Agriterribacter sp.]